MVLPRPPSLLRLRLRLRLMLGRSETGRLTAHYPPWHRAEDHPLRDLTVRVAYIHVAST